MFVLEKLLFLINKYEIYNLLDKLQYISINIEWGHLFILVFSGKSTELQIWASA